MKYRCWFKSLSHVASTHAWLPRRLVSQSYVHIPMFHLNVLCYPLFYFALRLVERVAKPGTAAAG